MRKTALMLGVMALGLSACGGEAVEDVVDDTATEGAATDAAADTAMVESEDALVPGTQYHATTQIPCGFDGGEPTESCEAGVIRKWGEDGTTLIEVQKPDGMKRAIFVRGTDPYGADSAEADGSAGWDFKTTRDGDEVTISYGPETYVIFDALSEGG